ncbi:hypothetical protein NB640_02175 [Oxalobacter vibrioformis]|uniref:Uncharacterized protein n=1 Tax=Oxalobacter vibrioformis TaxID=933080 RepID=A0A9E9LXG3_9BURK|nr:hypothetical protein [Oxalobacter vibrioformis]WAW10487.1 hypothetical protein NB640_02175 [Oxalobacter vibrioformis]
MAPDTQQETPPMEEKMTATTNNKTTGKTGWKGKRGLLLQETGTPLLSETGKEKEIIERLLDEEK